MAHPNVTERRSGHLWHLEDSKLKRYEAESLAKHLRKTEEKRARIKQVKDGSYEAWWAKK